MMNRLVAPAVLSLALVGAAAAARADDAAPTGQPTVKPVSLDLAPLKDWFNENRGRPRLVVLLSPT